MSHNNKTSNADTHNNPFSKGAKRGVVHLETDYASTYIKKSYDKTDEQRSLIYNAIKSNILFQSYDEAELNEIVHIFEPISVQQGEVLMRRGEQGEEFYVVQDGQLSVSAVGEDVDESVIAVSSLLSLLITYMNQSVSCSSTTSCECTQKR
jgi:hypothetical protein